ncbi:LysR family transcriptional regulator [Paenibacillus sp. J45TS6]|uniref:LysR family transcriptional regulator n=1 Tax=unclassified Paenibacillus TaxID=185978 RepID=UPI001B2534F6|nr:LysR family transcriptional regulator [Paenibacillus sp. J45TS6]GIP44272.1 LysR family transcriptional regulator [Paenibacillus sp. J45TS6]
MNMNVIKFQILVLIDRYNKVTDVARELQMKQPTVSFHMKSLEKDMGVPIYSAQQGRMMLTDAGRAILPHAKQILALTDTVKRTVQQFSSLGQGDVLIHADSLAAENVLPELMSRFASEYPGITVRNSLIGDSSGEGNAEDSFLLARTEKQPLPQEPESSDYVLLQQDQLVLVSAKDHPLLMSDSVKPSDLSQILFVDYESQGLLGKYTEQFTEQTNIHLWKRVSAATPQAALRTVSLGNAFTFLPASMLSSTSANIISMPIPGLEEQDTRLCTYLYRRKDLSPAASAFWNFITP